MWQPRHIAQCDVQSGQSLAVTHKRSLSCSRGINMSCCIWPIICSVSCTCVVIVICPFYPCHVLRLSLLTVASTKNNIPSLPPYPCFVLGRAWHSQVFYCTFTKLLVYIIIHLLLGSKHCNYCLRAFQLRVSLFSCKAPHFMGTVFCYP